jgi:Uma2 family endonuclease
MSFEQYLLLINNSDQRYEYYDGQVRLLAGESSNHATIVLNFGVALDQALGDDALCRPYVTDKLVRVTPTKTVIPDVLVSCDIADHADMACHPERSEGSGSPVRRSFAALRMTGGTSLQSDHGESQIIDAPVLVVEVLSRSTELIDRFVKLALYQAKESIQEIIFISQVIQRIEVFSRSATDWLYHQYGAGQSFHLGSLDIDIEVRQLYRRLSIPAVVERVEEEGARL